MIPHAPDPDPEKVIKATNISYFLTLPYPATGSATFRSDSNQGSNYIGNDYIVISS